ncbi:MAG TPA: hypothetical protein VKI43_05725, partial [Vicinamibacterales bacterium]|nr:hypothetical protein [Vicinamibacterales bacterium]
RINGSSSTTSTWTVGDFFGMGEKFRSPVWLADPGITLSVKTECTSIATTLNQAFKTRAI